MTPWETFKQDYPAALAAAMVAHPADYMTGIDAATVAAKMIAAIEAKGIGGVSIQSHSFKALAKRYGIKNTYKDWRAWLGCKWFLLCENLATLTEPHPTLGDVPICARCHAKNEALK